MSCEAKHFPFFSVGNFRGDVGGGGGAGRGGGAQWRRTHTPHELQQERAPATDWWRGRHGACAALTLHRMPSNLPCNAPASLPACRPAGHNKLVRCCCSAPVMSVGTLARGLCESASCWVQVLLLFFAVDVRSPSSLCVFFLYLRYGPHP